MYRKLNFIIFTLVLFSSLFVCSSCKPNDESTNQENLDLKEIYDNNMELAIEYYRLLGNTTIVLINKNDIDKSAYEKMKNMMVFDFNSIICSETSTNYTVLACEFENSKVAESALKNFFEKDLPGVFTILKNIVFQDIYPSYILFDKGYDVSENIWISKDLKKLIRVEENAYELCVPPSVMEITGFSCALSNLERVCIGKNVKKIGPAAFNSCDNLNYLKLNDCLYMIRKMAFYDCEKLQNVVIPKSVSIIEKKLLIMVIFLVKYLQNRMAGQLILQPVLQKCIGQENGSIMKKEFQCH